MERILALSPTIVVGIGQPNSAAFSSLRKKGIQVLLFDSPQKIDDIYTIISHVGTAMGHQERAKQVVLSLRTQVREIERSKPKIAPSVLIVIWHPPLTVAAGNTFISDMVHKAGGINVIESGFTPYPKLQRETMLYKNPEIILVADPGAISAVHTDAMIKLTLAAKYGFIVSSIDPNLLLRPGPRFPMAMRQIQPILIAASPHE
jgi:ABC-type hemin transport system substrate-binding protein